MKNNDKTARETTEVDERYDTTALAKNVIVKDLVGSDDWKRSKVGYLTGASVIKRSVGTVGNTANESLNRLSTLTSSVFGRENVQALPEGGNAKERFIQSMIVHNRSEDDIIAIQTNTYRASILYFALTLIAAFLGVASLFSFSPRDFADALTRFVPLYIVGPLLLKYAYTNWVVRTRQLGTLLSFLKSFDWVPKK